MALLVLITINVHFEISANILIFFANFTVKSCSFCFIVFFSFLQKCFWEMRKLKAYKTAVLSVEEEGKCDESWWQYLEVWANVLIINKFSAQSEIVRYPSNISAFRDDISIETYLFVRFYPFLSQSFAPKSQITPKSPKVIYAVFFLNPLFAPSAMTNNYKYSLKHESVKSKKK